VTGSFANWQRTDKLARMCRFNGRTYYVAMLTFYARGSIERAMQMQESMFKERAYVELQESTIGVYADDADCAIVSMLP
jgi:hypothetical protein